MKAYKIFTHDFRSPLQGGEPVWDGSLPYQLPAVKIDMGPQDCAAGWNACADPVTASEIAGLWRDGWPARLYEVEAPGGCVWARGNKLRSNTWTVTRELDMRDTIRELSQAFGSHADEMALEQIAWYEALGRPSPDEGAVVAGLQTALDRRGLKWTLRRYDTVRAARDARAAWDAGDAWEAWEARDARVALVVYYASLMGWTEHQKDLLSAGLLEAYRNGLAIAIPVSPDTLGWAMAEMRT
jgi:hypothetical protein